MFSSRPVGYRPITPSTPIHSPHPSSGSVRSKTPGQLSLHEYRKLQASASPMAVDGQRTVKRRAGLVGLQGSSSSIIGGIPMVIPTAPPTPPAEEAFDYGTQFSLGLYDPPQSSSLGTSFLDPSSPDLSFSQPPAPLSHSRSQPLQGSRYISSHPDASSLRGLLRDYDYSRSLPQSSTRFSPPSPFTSSKPLQKLPTTSDLPDFSTPTSQSGPFSLLHHSLHAPSVSSSAADDFFAKPHTAPRERHFNPIKRLPRPLGAKSHSPFQSSPLSAQSPFATSSISSPISISRYDFPPPPPSAPPQLETHTSSFPKLEKLSSSPLRSEGANSSFSELIHLYGASFELINKRDSFSLEHIPPTPAEDSSVESGIRELAVPEPSPMEHPREAIKIVYGDPGPVPNRPPPSGPPPTSHYLGDYGGEFYDSGEPDTNDYGNTSNVLDYTEQDIEPSSMDDWTGYDQRVAMPPPLFFQRHHEVLERELPPLPQPNRDVSPETASYPFGPVAGQSPLIVPDELLGPDPNSDSDWDESEARRLEIRRGKRPVGDQTREEVQPPNGDSLLGLAEAAAEAFAGHQKHNDTRDEKGPEKLDISRYRISTDNRIRSPDQKEADKKLKQHRVVHGRVVKNRAQQIQEAARLRWQQSNSTMRSSLSRRPTAVPFAANRGFRSRPDARLNDPHIHFPSFSADETEIILDEQNQISRTVFLTLLLSGVGWLLLPFFAWNTLDALLAPRLSNGHIHNFSHRYKRRARWSCVIILLAVMITLTVWGVVTGGRSHN